MSPLITTNNLTLDRTCPVAFHFLHIPVGFLETHLLFFGQDSYAKLSACLEQLTLPIIVLFLISEKTLILQTDCFSFLLLSPLQRKAFPVPCCSAQLQLGLPFLSVINYNKDSNSSGCLLKVLLSNHYLLINESYCLIEAVPPKYNH